MFVFASKEGNPCSIIESSLCVQVLSVWQYEHLMK